MLAGARFDAGCNTLRKVTRMTDADTADPKNLPNPVLSANDADTVANELRTHLVVPGNDDTGEGMFSIGSLLGSGMASDDGERFIDEAVKAIEKVQADVTALLALDSKPTGLDDILRGQWNNLKKALDPIFGTDSTPATGAESVVRITPPREEDILDDIADILDALSSEASFVAATADGGGGAFATATGGHGVLGAGGAAKAFNRLMWNAEATLGMTGSTRYGTALRKTSANATKDPSLSQYGAFSYATMEETLRTADAAAVSLTGIASYSGGTRAVSGAGKAYSGRMDLQVRFKANSVSGVVSGLEDSEGLPWQHNFADVDRIVLDDGTLHRNAQWTHTGNAGSNASVFYAANSGLLRPVDNQPNTFAGILLGRGADAGSEANGVWSLGRVGGTGYLEGGFGVEHVGDTDRPVPTEDDGSAATAMLTSRAPDPAAVTGRNAADSMTDVTIADGVLTVKQRSYGWDGRDGTTDPEYQALTDSDGGAALLTAKFDLADMAEKGAGATTTVNGPKWVDQVVTVLEEERALLSTLQGLDSDDTQPAERAAWQRVQDAVEFQLLGALPLKLAVPYDDPDGSVANELESEADALDLIDRALEALSSNANLAAALDPDGTGIFDHYADGDDADTDPDNFVNAAKTTVNNQTFAQMRGERVHKVIATLGTTSYTRFGAWLRESTRSAVRSGSPAAIRHQGGPGTFAYSPLDPTNAGTPTNPGFPRSGRATYTGETVAIQNTTILTGTVRVDVGWNSLADSTNGLNADGDAIVTAGTMSLTISGLASTVGDPLSHGGSRHTRVSDVITERSGAPGNEIADIVLGGLSIVAGAAGGNSGQLIVGTATEGAGTSAGTFAYSEIAAPTNRLRFSALGIPDVTTVPGSGIETSGVNALFVGQGVDGPLGVIGTWTVQDSTIARISADGSEVSDPGAAIYGAFGAQVP